MMLHSAAADMPRGLRKPFPGRGNALGRGRNGLGDTLLEQSLAYNWRDHINDTTPAVMTPEWTAYYGAGGTYSQVDSVERAAAEQAQSSVSAPGASSAPPMQYAMESCGFTDADCFARNDSRQQANFVLAENARREFNLETCRYNDSLNPGVADCSQYNPLPVPAAPGVPVAAVILPGGGYATPIAGETAAQQAANLRAWTARQAASATTNQPNQSVPPRPQPGEVPTGGGLTAAELAAILAAQNKQTPDDGKVLGLDPKMLMLIAAGVGALMLLKK